MSHADVGEWLAGQAVGATMPNLNAEIVSRLPLSVPLVATQRRIAAVLSAFDELIEINWRRIELLDDLARSLYREWFVRFRFPDHEEVEFVDSELGPIPKGWAVVSLIDACTSLLDGDWIETKDQGGSAYRLLQVSNIGVGAFRETGHFRHISEETYKRLRCTAVEVGDILISRMPEPIGRAWLVDDLSERAITAVDVAILRPASSENAVYLNYWLNAPETLAHAEAVATGTTRKRISRSVLAKVRLVMPYQKRVEHFARVVKPLRDQRTALNRAQTSLAATRDLLLPRLVTGRLDISEIDLDALLPAEPT